MVDKIDDGSVTDSVGTAEDYGLVTQSVTKVLDYGFLTEGYEIYPWPTYDVFPLFRGLSWPMTKTPIWKTIIQESYSQRETRIGAVVFPRWKWTLTFDIIRSMEDSYEYQVLIDFISTHRGPLISFDFWDPTDNYVINQWIANGDNVTQSFQMSRSMGSIGISEPVRRMNRSITNLVVPNVVYLDGVAQDVDYYTISDTGILSFETAPVLGVRINADFNYFWAARLVNDENDLDYAMYRWWELKKLELISIKT